MTVTETKVKNTKKKSSQILVHSTLSNNITPFFIFNEHGVFKVENSKIVGQIDVDTVSHLFASKKPQQTPILPDNTKFYQSDKGAVCVIIEVSPRYHLLHFREKYSPRNDTSSVKIFYPWLYFILGIKDVSGQPVLMTSCLQYRNSKMSSLDDTCATPAFPNVYASGDICWGKQNLSTDKSSLCNFVNSSLDGFWASEVNSDLGLVSPSFMDDLSEEEQDAFHDQPVYDKLVLLSRRTPEQVMKDKFYERTNFRYLVESSLKYSI